MKCFSRSHVVGAQIISLLCVLMWLLAKPVSATPSSQATNSTPAPSAASPIQLETSVTVANEVTTYTLYPTNTARQSAWNVLIRLPLTGPGTLLKAGATPPFAATFDGEAVIFYAPELGPRSTIGPLVLQVAHRTATTTTLTIEPEISWQTLRTVMRQSELLSNQAQGKPFTIQADAVRQTVFDQTGDVPSAGYDLTGISLEKEGASLKIIFTTAGVLGTTSEASEFYLYLDNDCSPQTGKLRTNYGIDYRVRYRHAKAQADISDWLATAGTNKTGDWGNARSVSVSASTDGTTVTVWVPMIAFQEDRFFCWLAETQRKTDPTAAKLPKDELPDFTKDPRLTVYRAWDETTGAFALETMTNTTSLAESSPGALLWAGLPPFTTTVLTPVTVTGKIAVPLANAGGTAEVQLWSTIERQLLTTIVDARQPDFRADGERLLFNRMAENTPTVYEYTVASGEERPVSEGLTVALPSYNPAGDRVVYAGVSVSATTAMVAPLYVQCSLTLPSTATDAGCRQVAELGRLSGDKEWGDVIGSDPLWGADDQILFRSCPVWDGSRRCGIYTIAAASTLSTTIRNTPVQLFDDPSAIPTDTQGTWLTFMAKRAGDWEIYVMARDGSWLQNLSADATAQDGLPTFSPDGRWVAFVSNRAGAWAVWAISIQGGSAQKLFDLPADALWDQETLRWAPERISWGP
jgi:WD40-like Beta Propeller Repeat